MTRHRDSVKARRIVFETHRTTDHIGRTVLICHWCKHPFDPIREKWRADHIRRHAEDGEETAENLWPIHSDCDRNEKAPLDTREVAKGKRVGENHWGIKRAKGFRKPPEGYVYDWGSRRYVKAEAS